MGIYVFPFPLWIWKEDKKGRHRFVLPSTLFRDWQAQSAVTGSYRLLVQSLETLPKTLEERYSWSFMFPGWRVFFTQACSTEERRRDFEKIFAHYDVVSVPLYTVPAPWRQGTGSAPCGSPHGLLWCLATPHLCGQVQVPSALLGNFWEQSKNGQKANL